MESNEMKQDIAESFDKRRPKVEVFRFTTDAIEYL